MEKETCPHAYLKHMLRNQSKILAIDPGTKYMGVALLEGGALIYSGVKVIKNRRSAQEILREGRKILLRLLRDYRPNLLVIEKTFFAKNRSTALLNVLADEIRNVAKRKGLEVVGLPQIR